MLLLLLFNDDDDDEEDDEDDDDEENGGKDEDDDASVCLISFNKLYKLVSSVVVLLFSFVFKSWFKKLDILLSLLMLLYLDEFIVLLLVLFDKEAKRFCPNDNSFELSSLIISFLYLFNSVLNCSLLFSEFV